MSKSAKAERKASEEAEGFDLKDIIANAMVAFVSAKESMDHLSAATAESYSKNELLSALSLPFFSISEADVLLKYVVLKKERDKLLVSIDAETLTKVPESAISQASIKLTPQNVKLYRTEEAKTPKPAANKSGKQT